MNSASQKLGALFKTTSIFILCSILLLYSPLIVNASDATTASSGSSSDDYVTVNMPLTWTTDVWIGSNGEEYIDDVGSVTDFLSIIQGATYTVNLSAENNIHNGCAVFYYTANKSFISGQNLWINSVGAQSADLLVPAGAAYFKILSSLNVSDNALQNIVQLQITVLESYLEEHDVVEETLVDVVYRDDNSIINDSADKLTSESELLFVQEDYLIEESRTILTAFSSNFSWDALNEYSAGFEYLATWFGNFYNSHSVVNTMVGMGSALTLLFIIIRFKGS